MDSPRNAWLMKAEPEPRIVKDHEAKNIMKEKMKKRDHVLFYHSNCGLSCLICSDQSARSQESPESLRLRKKDIQIVGCISFTAFDVSHPYYDPKSVESNPTWFMVDVKFVSRLPNFVPLKLLQGLVSGNVNLPDYLTSNDVQAIKGMPLLNRGRLSVQPVSLEAFEAIRNLGVNGGWSSIEKASSTGKPSATSQAQPTDTDLKDAQANKREAPSRTTDVRRSKRSKK
ncbi:hypothetical protein VP01_385g3 [Puccinia sorghi]|uniref:EVE domain-containing protein n=1 Tax=Puccinia sorghi TaxID=27349 RepID=A0A0L6UT60_9BASI|nr:hypothetical protein VP01_385g3 [Puccinia sorghi]